MANATCLSSFSTGMLCRDDGEIYIAGDMIDELTNDVIVVIELIVVTEVTELDTETMAGTTSDSSDIVFSS